MMCAAFISQLVRVELHNGAANECMCACLLVAERWGDRGECTFFLNCVGGRRTSQCLCSFDVGRQNLEVSAMSSGIALEACTCTPRWRCVR
jgi:hypothetical protein